MRNHSNLLDSLEQYVKGELLEGVDAYYCDKCDKKVIFFSKFTIFNIYWQHRLRFLIFFVGWKINQFFVKFSKISRSIFILEIG